MKVQGHGKAAPLTDEQFQQLLDAAPSPKYRCLWAVQRYTAARVTEALNLRWMDVQGVVTYRKATTKTKSTRQVPICPPLQAELDRYAESLKGAHKGSEYLFHTDSSTTQPMTRQAAHQGLVGTCKRIGLQGVSTHSFRRTCAQQMVAGGTALHIVQAVTGHKSLGSLGEYLSASESDVLAALPV